MRLNYVGFCFLIDLKHSKIINFGSEPFSLESRHFVIQSFAVSFRIIKQ